MINIFISHAWTYSHNYATLHKWIFQEHRNTVDTSIPKNDPVHASNDHQLSMAIATRIATSQAVIAPSGMYANYSRWIKYELQFAQSNHVPIVGINLWGSQRHSSTVLSSATIICNWNKASLVNALQQVLT